MKPRISTPSHSFPIIQSTVKNLGLKTVCQESRCPNQSECWSGGTATFMILGDTCTRACKFCHVKTFHKPEPPDQEEPDKLARAVKSWGLDYVVITSVDRDDLEDQGASHFARAIRAVRRENPGILIEVLIPDFRGSRECLETIVRARPNVIAHNIETVSRLQSVVRDPRAGYEQSLHVLETVKQLSPETFTKSSLMLGFGERDQEVLQALHNLRSRGVDFLTLGQYLRPSLNHLPVTVYVPQEKWSFFRTMGEEIGFLYVASGPLVRSSYRAGELFLKNFLPKRRINTF